MKAAIYTRVSTEKQAEKYSLPAQQKLCTELCTRNGWEVVDALTDDGYSGSLFEERPAFIQLLNLAAQKKIDVIVTTDTDRLARPDNLVDLGRLQQVLIGSGVKLASIGGRVSDLSNSSDWFFSSLESLMAGWERKKIKERVKRGVREKKQQGHYWGVGVPSGYRREGKNLVLRETREIKIGKRQGCKYTLFSASEVREMFTRYLAGDSVNAISRAIGTTDTVVGPILDRALFYAGHILEDYKDNKHTARVHRLREPIAKGIHHPIISEEEARRALELRAEGFKFHQESRDRYASYGLVHCGVCNSPLHLKVAIKPSDRRYHYYVCSSKRNGHRKDTSCDLPWRRIDEVESAAWKLFEEIVVTPDIVFSLLKGNNTNTIQDRLRNDILNLEKEIADLKTRKTRISELYEFVQSKEETANLKSRLAVVNSELATKARKIEAYRRDLATQESLPERGEDILHAIRMLADIVEGAQGDERRDLLRQLFDQIVVEKGGALSYRLRIPLNGESIENRGFESSVTSPQHCPLPRRIARIQEERPGGPEATPGGWHGNHIKGRDFPYISVEVHAGCRHEPLGMR